MARPRTQNMYSTPPAGDFAEVGTQFPIKHKILQNSRFLRFILAKTRFPVEKHEDESSAWQQRVKLPITVATRAKSSRFQSSANEIENLSKVCQTICLSEQKVHRKPILQIIRKVCCSRNLIIRKIFCSRIIFLSFTSIVLFFLRPLPCYYS